ncbi:MAG: HD-GYP domain-containing protein [Candidatus Hydrogenedentes bacterium]|nr:HD-GYP domain-containing protein [Candidatus Hydrogenedentota bacterium]
MSALSSAVVPTPAWPGFRRIPLASLRVDTATGFDIYIAVDGAAPPVLYRAHDVPVSQENLAVLADRGRVEILVSTSQESAYQQYVEDNLDLILADKNTPIEERSQVLYESATYLMRSLFDSPRSPEMVPRSKAMVANASALLRNEQVAFEHLLSLISYDYYTYTHSVNVFLFSYMLAQFAGYNDPALLQDLGEGALLHDIGKSLIDASIIQCEGKLTDSQWNEMKKHPEYGLEILRQHNAFGELALKIVLHHHEKLDGSGYPHGLKGYEIDPVVRISTIADVFDAMTTRRPYRDAVESFPALQVMRKEMSHQLDPSLFRMFVEMMGNPRREQTHP